MPNNPPHNALRAAVSRAIASGSPVITEQAPDPLQGMTQAKWDSLSPLQKGAIRSDQGLTKQLVGLEGWRVEVVDNYGEKRRFFVGRSTGWIPCHLEIKTRRSSGGGAAEKSYASVTKIRKEY